MATPESPTPSSNKFLLYLILIVCGITAFYSYKSLQAVQHLTDELLPEEAELPAPGEPVNKKPVRKGAIEVAATYRIEDRYVSYGGIKEPDYLGDQEGQVIVNISVDKSGDVKKTSINNTSTISDPEVLEAARKAALKTNFNFNFDAPNLQSGTITYTFKIQ